MRAQLLTGALILTLLISPASAIAQTTSSSSLTEDQQKSKKELERKALVMLDEIIKDSQSYRLADNRLRLKATAANLLWKYDEARARVLFKETMAGVVDLLNTQDADGATSPFRRGITQLRQDIVTMLAARDARLAREFLRATRQQVAGKNSTPTAGDYDPDLQFEYSLASQLTETDSKQALEVATENLNKGFSQEVLNTLRALREKDREAATKLAGDIMAKLRSENLTTNQEAANVAYGLLSIVLEVEGESAGTDKKDAKPLLDEAALRALMEMSINVALASGDASRVQTLAGLMPYVEKYAPSRAAEIRRRAAQATKTAPAVSENEEGESGPGTNWTKYQSLTQTGTAEELLAEAAKAPPEMRDYLYQAAATKFIEKGELDRARDIINNNFSNPALRKQALAELESKASLTAAEEGKIEQVRKSLASLRTNEERATLLAQISSTLAAKGDLKVARQLLDEAQAMVNYRAKNITQLGAQLLVAQAYVRIAPERSLAMLESIVDQLNDLLAAAVMLGSFILDEEVMGDDEIRMEVLTGILPMFTEQFTPDLRALAAHDFERTRALAERFQRDEVRMMARLLVVQSVLGEEAKPGGTFSAGESMKKAEIVVETPAAKDSGDGEP